MAEIPTATRFDQVLRYLKNRWWYVALLAIGAFLIWLGGVSDAVAKMGRLWSGSVAARQDASTALVLLPGTTSANRVEFSLANRSSEKTFEVTSLAAKELSRVDLCRTCLLLGRRSLVLDLRQLADNGPSAQDSAGSAQLRLFGRDSTLVLAPGETAAFAISLRRMAGWGSVLLLSASVNDLREGVSKEWVPPFIFYVGGPFDFKAPFFEVYSFDGWLTARNSFIRADIAAALGQLTDSRVLESLRRATADPEVEVRHFARVSFRQILVRRRESR